GRSAGVSLPARLPVGATARAIGVEQSNSSFVVGDATVLKVLRRLEPGGSPELEMLQFLTAHEFPGIAALQGFYEYEGRAFSSTLGVAQRYCAGAIGGWELALDIAGSDPDGLLVMLAQLGEITAQMHNCLGSDAADPAFSPEEPSAESLSLLTATIDEDIERIFTRLPDDARVGPIAGRGQDVRERMSIRSTAGPSGRLIRTHGDYHLGQVLRTAQDGWLIIDFEGEPARPLHERRQKRSALRDVASMLRSFAYLVSAAQQLGTPARADFERSARAAFLDSWLEAIDPGLLPAGEPSVLNLLAIYELEKAIYELQYELENRPDWLPIPVAGIARLLESG
ncbi:MAG: phosphotransferase, partial [Solirubrobacteraceae bacterium]